MIYSILVICSFPILTQADFFGPFYFPSYDLPARNVQIADVTISGSYYPQEVVGRLISHIVWKSELNYHFLYYYTTVQERKFYNPGLERVSRILSNKSCLLGDNEENSDICWKGIDEIVNHATKKWTQPRSIDFQQPSIVPFSSTCLLKWGCEIAEVTLPIFVEPTVRDKPFYAFVKSPSGEKIKLNNSINVIVSRESVIVLPPVQESKSVSLPSKCVTSSGSVSICVVPLENRNVSIKFKDNFASYKNWALYVEQLTIYKETEKITENRLKKSMRERLARFQEVHNNSSRRRRSADTTYDLTNNLDLREVENQIMILENQMHFDMLNLEREITQLKNILITIIKSISKIDDGLIGELLKIPSHSKWVNPQNFVLKEDVNSYLMISNINKNCLEHFVFTNGRWVLKNNQLLPMECKNITNSIPISVFADQDVEEIRFSDIEIFHRTQQPYEHLNYLHNPHQVIEDTFSEGAKGPFTNLFRTISQALTAVFGLSSTSFMFVSFLIIFICARLLAS